MMKIEAFVLCDAATEYMGKLNILGTFDTIHARQIPAVHALCALAIRLRFERIERGEHKIRVNLVNEDGQTIVPPLDATVQVMFPDELPSYALNLVLNLQGMRFQKYGEYSVDLAIDGRHEASLPLFVRAVPTPPHARPHE